MNVEKEKINGKIYEIYSFDNPMYHEDWHKVDELGLTYIQYNHNGPDYWDDTLCFCKKDDYEIVKKWFDENRW